MPDFFSRPVVCNTGPVLGLSRAGLCRLPGEIFPVVIIPEPVLRELHARQTADAAEVARVVAVAQVHQLGTAPDPLPLPQRPRCGPPSGGASSRHEHSRRRT